MSNSAGMFKKNSSGVASEHTGDERPWLVPMLFFILNVIIKSFSVTKVSYDLDEAWHTFYSQWSVSGILKQAGEDPNGPLYNLILHFWMLVFGNSETATRSLSVLFSALTAPLMYLFGKKFLSKEAGIFSVLIFSFSNLHFFYSHNARVYTLICFLAMWSLYLFLQLIKGGRPVILFWYAVVNTLMLYTHLTTAFLLVAQVAYSLLLFRSEQKNMLLSWIGIAAPVLLFIPWAMSSPYFNKPKASSWLTLPKWNDVWETWIDFAGSVEILYLFIALFFIAAVSLLVKINRQKTMSFLFLAFCFFIPVVCSVEVSSHLVPIFITKYVILSSLGLYMLTGNALAIISIRSIVKVFLLAVILFLSFSVLGGKNFTGEDWKSAVKETLKYKSGRTMVVISPAYQAPTFTFYYNKNYFSRPDSMKEFLKKEKIIFPETLDEILLAPSDYDNVVLITSHEKIVNPAYLVSYFKNNFRLTHDTAFPSIRMYFFEKASPLAYYADNMESQTQSFQIHKIIESDIAHSGKHVCLLDKKNQCSNTFSDRAGAFPAQAAVKACGWVYAETKNISCLFVVSVENAKGAYIYKVSDLKEMAVEGKWFQVCSEIKLPAETSPQDAIKVYFWNQGKENIYIDDMEVSEVNHP